MPFDGEAVGTFPGIGNIANVLPNRQHAYRSPRRQSPGHEPRKRRGPHLPSPKRGVAACQLGKNMSLYSSELLSK